MKFKKLNPFEIDFSGINLVEASAGTGKTYNISSLYVRALIEKDLSVDQILVVTYTEAATKELRDRLIKRLRESLQSIEGKIDSDDEFLNSLTGWIKNKEVAKSQLRRAIRTFDSAAIFTIHGFCYHALQEHAFESRSLFDAELIGDDTDLVREAVDDYWRKWVHEASDDLDKRPLLKLLLDEGYVPDELVDELSGPIGKPYLKLRPDSNKIPEFDKEVNRLREIFEQMQKIWQKEREDIESLLHADQLDGTKYRSSFISSWANDMDDQLKGDVPPVSLFDKFQKFTDSVLQASIKKSSNKPAPSHPFFELADAYLQLAESIAEFPVYFKIKLFDYLRARLREKKAHENVLSYDDLLVHLRDALHQPEGGERLIRALRSTYPIALVDEFQDTDPIQYDLFQTIYKESSEDTALFMIGDPKQSIYSFRGADVYSYIQAKKDVPSDSTYGLERNFRSVPGLISAVNVLFGRHDKPFILEKIPYVPVDPGKREDEYKQLHTDGKTDKPVSFRWLQMPSDDSKLNKSTAENRCAQDTARQIAQLLKKGGNEEAKIGDCPVKAGDIAVLVRYHSQAALIRDALREHNIKSVQYSQESVFHTEQADQIQTVLRAVAEPADESLIKAALATKMIGYKADDILELENDETAWAQKMDQFSRLHKLWQENGYSVMISELMSEESVAERVIRHKNGERILTNILHLGELLQNEERDHDRGIRSLLNWLARKRNEEKKDIEEEQLRLESDEHLVKVVTMHRSKGLEYPIVYCPFLWNAVKLTDGGKPLVYHDEEDKSMAYLDFSGESDPDLDRKRFQVAKEELAESVRLAYVAITRARQKCIISCLHRKKSEISPLEYLLLGQHTSFEKLKEIVYSEHSYQSLGPDVLKKELEKLIADNDSLFELSLPETDEQREFQWATPDKQLLKARGFSRKKPLLTGPYISSFSSLVRNEKSELDSEYELYLDDFWDESIGEDPELITGSPPDEKGESDVFHFPKGPKPGTAIHHIFEQIDFSDPVNLNEVVKESLSRQGIAGKWAPVARRMVKATLNTPLKAEDPDFRLSALSSKDVIAELEFYFPSEEATLPELLNLIRTPEHVPVAVMGKSEKGYLKGFIDLIFRYRDRYYILDYKTNYLGNTYADYAQEHLNEEMRDALYDLQYHIYTLALHRYLQNVIDDYQYNSNFGGVFYLFLRGLNANGSEGIYFDRPEIAVVEKLDNYFKGQAVHE